MPSAELKIVPFERNVVPYEVWEDWEYKKRSAKKERISLTVAVSAASAKKSVSILPKPFFCIRTSSG